MGQILGEALIGLISFQILKQDWFYWTALWIILTSDSILALHIGFKSVWRSVVLGRNSMALWEHGEAGTLWSSSSKSLNKVARRQNLIPSFSLISLGRRSRGAMQRKGGIKFCSLAERSHSPSSPKSKTYTIKEFDFSHLATMSLNHMD